MVTKDSIELRGRNTTRRYEMAVAVHDGGLTMNYRAHRLNAAGWYEGEAHYQRGSQ